MPVRVGFIGLGNQGKPIAAHLVPAGFETTVYDVVREPVDELVAAGARAGATPREVGAAADLVGICVPEDRHVRAVVLGEAGAGRGVEVLDACVTGGAARAANRQHTYLVGGPQTAFEKARPYFAATSDVEPIHAGELGNGAKLKLCVNLTTYIQWAAAYEPMLLARAIGLPQEVLEKAGRANGQLTDLMLAYLAGHKAPESARRSAAYQSLMRNHMLIAEKDLAWVMQLAREGGVALPVGSLVSQLMARLYGVEDEGRR
jgi:3-hydroxyisobutyrate dehydrogenase-like beta-hydroxyacid dehydrogenase